MLLQDSGITVLGELLVKLKRKGKERGGEVWRPVGITTAAPQDCIYLQTLKASAWGSGIQSAWN